MDTSQKHIFSADRAIETILEDRLDRKFFAAKLAKAVCGWRQNDSLVLAIYGKWGFGKTSLKNLFKCYCKEEGDPFIIEFNPWQWSAQDKIFEAFFKTVWERLKKPDIAKQSKELAKKWKSYAALWGVGTALVDSFSESLPLILGCFGGFSALAASLPSAVGKPILWVVGLVGLMSGAVLKFLPKLFKETADYHESRAALHEKDAEERRKELVKELGKLNQPLIVIIDDFDRLNKEEIKTVIQLVKANTDLPNVVYVLLYHEEILAKALDETWQRGREYLEKIVQVGFDVPEAPGFKLRKILFEDLNEILKGIDFGERWKKERWEYVFNDYLKPYFRTLRDVHRFLSMLKFHMELHRNGDAFEVNPIDLILLHTLRVFERPVFERIRDSAVSDASRWMKALYFESLREEKSERRKLQLEEIVRGVEPSQRSRVEGIIMELFPQVSPHFRGNDENWNRDLRICHEEHFPKYFELRDEAISALEISNFIHSANDAKKIAAMLEDFRSKGNIGEFLLRIEDYIDSISEHDIASFVRGCSEIGDTLPEAKPQLLSIPPINQLARMLRNLLERLPQDSRAQVMITSFSGSNAFTVLPFVISFDEKRPGNEQPQNPLLDDDAVNKVKVLAAENIKNAANDGRLKKSEHFLWLLNTWRLWGGDGGAVKWASDFASTPTGALALTMGAVNIGSISGHRGTRTFDTLLLKWLERFVEIEVVWDKIHKLQIEELGEREKHVLALFKRGLENKKKGEPYDRLSDDRHLFD